MELELPGVEKKNRWEAKMVAKSGGESVSTTVSSESSEEEKKSELVLKEGVRDLEVGSSDEEIVLS